MFNIFKENKKKIKIYRITKVYNIYTQEEEEINITLDSIGLNNLIINGCEIISMEEI